MATYRCPSCQKPFNGKKCRHCLYEQFEGACPPGEHTHTKAPAAVEVHVPQAPARQVQRPAAQPRRKTAKTKKKSPRWLVWVLVLTLLEPALAIVTEVFDDLGGVFETSTTAVSSVALPENAQKILSQDGFTLYIQPTDDPLYFSVFLENTTGQDGNLSARSIVADGFLTERSHLYCSSPAGTTHSGSLSLEEEDLSYAFLGTPSQISVQFVIYDSDTYEDILEGTFLYDLGDTPLSLDPGGEVLLDSNGVQLRYLGYEADEYTPEEFCEGQLVFYAENTTDYELSIFSDTSTLDGYEGPTLWVTLPANTRTVTRVYFYSLDEEAWDTVGPDSLLEMTVTASDMDGSYGYTTLGSFSIPLS